VKLVKAKILWFSHEGFGIARVDGFGDLYVRTGNRQHPKVDHGQVTLEPAISDRLPERHNEVLLKITATKKGPRVTMWVFLDEYVKARRPLLTKHPKK